jgi:hypothetical protein
MHFLGIVVVVVAAAARAVLPNCIRVGGDAAIGVITAQRRVAVTLGFGAWAGGGGSAVRAREGTRSTLFVGRVSEGVAGHVVGVLAIFTG